MREPRTSNPCETRAGQFGLLLAFGVFLSSVLSATSVIPITDRELLSRADVVVHGVVVSSDVTVDWQGRPETVTVIEPLAVLKGRLAGSLVLHQLGGTLPDGRFFKMWGRPEYAPGREVVVFAIARPEGEYQTAEMLLGKFEVWQDEAGNLFAVPDLAAGVHPGVDVQPGGLGTFSAEEDKFSRELGRFLASLRTGVFEAGAAAKPSGTAAPVHHPEKAGVSPEWGNIADSLFRWANNATATWTISGTANMDGGGIAEAQAALASWTNDPNSNINYTAGTGTSNIIYVNATTSILGCGWSTCLTGGGVIGCGGPTGVGGTNTWHGETYTNINTAVAEIRASCSFNGFGSTLTQSVLTHELGHTLGLGHSDQNISTHDVCRGDENDATMRAVVQNRTTLGTDDQDAIRWLYGDGGNSCTPGGPVPPTVTTNSASGVGLASATLNGTVNPNGKSTTAYFQYGTTTSYGSTTALIEVGSGTLATPVSSPVSGLTCNKVYHFRTVGTNSDGTSYGPDMSLTTNACPPTPPTVTTNAATAIAQSNATLKATVNPNGTSTNVTFEYGTTTSYGSTTTAQAIGSGTGNVAVSLTVYGLICNTVYHFRAVATTAYGTTAGNDMTFTTGTCTAAHFYTVTPCRLADTRNPAGASGGPALTPGGIRNFPVTGVCGIPSSATAVAVNLAVVMPSDIGDLRVYAAGAATPQASAINFRRGIVRANSAIVALGASGQVSVLCDMASGGTDFFFDVYGYFQ